MTAALCLLAWRLSSAADGDRKAFSVAVVAGLALSPIVWLNYFMLLLLPLGLRRPRLSPVWLVMLTPWVFANANTEAPLWKVAAFIAAAAVVLVVTVSDRWDHARRPRGCIADPAHRGRGTPSAGQLAHDFDHLNTAELERAQIDPLLA